MVGLPADVVASDINVASRLARIEMHGNTILIRDQTRAAANRAAVAPDVPTEPGEVPDGIPVGSSGADGFELSDPKLSPIEAAIGLTQTGPVIATLPIAETGPDGTIYLDMTPFFANDVGGLSAGIMPPSPASFRRGRSVTVAGRGCLCLGGNPDGAIRSHLPRCQSGQSCVGLAP